MKARARADLTATPDSGYSTGLILILLTVTVWGLQFPIAKDAFQSVNPYHLAIVRYGLPLLVLLAVLVVREGGRALRFDRNARLATVFGLVGMCGSPSLVFGGLAMTRPEIAAIIVATQPAMTAVVIWAMRGVRPDGFSLICIGVAFFGVFTVVTRWSPNFIEHTGELIGDAMILAGALCWVIYTIGAQRLSGWSILRVTTLTMLPGALGNLVVVLSLTWLGVITTPSLAQWQAASWHLVYLGGLGVLAAMLMWNAGTKRIGPLNAMLFQNLIPVITFGVRFSQGHQFEVLELVGAAIVIAALVANNLALRKRYRSRQPAT